MWVGVCVCVMPDRASYVMYVRSWYGCCRELHWAVVWSTHPLWQRLRRISLSPAWTSAQHTPTVCRWVVWLLHSRLYPQARGLGRFCFFFYSTATLHALAFVQDQGDPGKFISVSTKKLDGSPDLKLSPYVSNHVCLNKTVEWAGVAAVKVATTLGTPVSSINVSLPLLPRS